MWSIAPLGNEIRYRVISRLLSRRPAPAASQPRPYAVETDKPPKTHRCSGRSGSISSGGCEEQLSGCLYEPWRRLTLTHRTQRLPNTGAAEVGAAQLLATVRASG